MEDWYELIFSLLIIVVGFVVDNIEYFVVGVGVGLLLDVIIGKAVKYYYSGR